MNGKLFLKKIAERNGVIAGFQVEKIEHAIFKAVHTIGYSNREKAISVYSFQGLNQHISLSITSEYSFHLPYITISSTFSIWPPPEAGERFKYKSDCKAYSCIAGYKDPVNQWYNGKQQKFKDKKRFNIEKINLQTAYSEVVSTQNIIYV